MNSSSNHHRPASNTPWPHSGQAAIAQSEPAILNASASALIVVNAPHTVWHTCMESLAACAHTYRVHVVEVYRLTWSQYTQDACQLPPGLVLLCFDPLQTPQSPPGLARVLCKAQAQARHTWVPVFTGAYPAHKLPPTLMSAAPAQLDQQAELTDYINLLSVYLFLRPSRQPKPSRSAPAAPVAA